MLLLCTSIPPEKSSRRIFCTHDYTTENWWLQERRTSSGQIVAERYIYGWTFHFEVSSEWGGMASAMFSSGRRRNTVPVVHVLWPCVSRGKCSIALFDLCIAEKGTWCWLDLDGVLWLIYKSNQRTWGIHQSRRRDASHYLGHARRQTTLVQFWVERLWYSCWVTSTYVLENTQSEMPLFLFSLVDCLNQNQSDKDVAGTIFQFAYQHCSTTHDTVHWPFCEVHCHSNHGHSTRYFLLMNRTETLVNDPKRYATAQNNNAPSQQQRNEKRKAMSLVNPRVKRRKAQPTRIETADDDDTKWAKLGRSCST